MTTSPTTRRRCLLPTALSLAGDSVPVRVRTNPRARRMALRIDAQGAAIDLVLPPRTPLPHALSFLESNRQWLAKRLSALPPRIDFCDGALVPVKGVPHRIRHMPEARGRGAAWLDGREIRVAGDAAHLSRRVRDLLRELAKQELGGRVKRLAAHIGRKVGRITVRDTTTRWGSCSATGNLAFCWRLILAPEPVLDYVAAHEVAHLVEMNHGPRFWKLVDRLCADPDAQRAWLNRNRTLLLRIG